MVRIGSKGREVANLQKKLVLLGFEVAVDGDFGPKTSAVVKKFQRQSGLAIDGVVGPKTSAAIEKNLAKRPEIAPSHKLRIMLDVQHIGKASNPDDKGASANGLVECFEVAKYFKMAARLLGADGHRIFWAGINGAKGDYPVRARWANENGIELYLAGHLNSFDGKADYSLVEVAFNGSAASRRLAALLAEEFAFNLKTLGKTKILDKGERGNVCIQHTSMPAVILEPLFIDNPDHVEMLKKDGHKRIARAIANSVRRWSSKKSRVS